MNVFDENNEVVFSTEEIKNETRAAAKLEDEVSDQIDISDDVIEETNDEAAEDSQTFVDSSSAYGYFDNASDKGIIDQHESYARQGRNQEYYRDPTYHKVRRNYENNGYYNKENGYIIHHNKQYYGGRNYRPRYNDVYARNTQNSGDQTDGYSEQQSNYYSDDRRSNDSIPVYTGRKSRQFETVGCIIRMLDLAGFKLGNRLVLIDKETGEVFK